MDASVAPTDPELVARSQQRDTAAFSQLVERHQRLVFGVALARCGDRSLAEDVAQDAFVIAWRDLERLRNGQRVGPWIAGIARNLAIDAARRRQRADRMTAGDPNPVPTPEDAALAREDSELLAQALAEIPQAHREVLVLYYLEGTSIARIAAGLHIREDLVKQRLSRGRRSLRDLASVRERSVEHVENSLSGLLPSVGFGAAVVAAIVALRSTEAAAATSGGKALATMTGKTKLIVAAAAAVVVTGGAMGFVKYGIASSAPSPKQAASNGSAPSVDSAAKPDPARPHVRRMADPSQRQALLDRIRAANQQRKVGSGAPRSTTSGGPGPVLGAGDEDDDSYKDYLGAALKDLRPLIEDCYREGLNRQPSLAGKIAVEFTIESDPELGAVISESKTDTSWSTLGDPGVQQCVQDTMYALELDPLEEGSTLSARTHLVFSNTGEPPPDE